MTAREILGTLIVWTTVCMVVPLAVGDAPYGGFDTPAPVDASLASSRKAMMDLEQGWAQPPRIARTRCWWWWLNGNVNKEAIRRDLAAMKEQGYGGANIIDAGGATQGGHAAVPHGPDFGSPAWRELFVYALEEADKQGLEMGFNILSGWNLGGPTVTPEQAAKKLTWSDTVIEGGQGGAVDVPLKAPPSRDGYYRDVAVVAFPLRAAPAGVAPTVTAGSSQSGFPPVKALDGNTDTFWVSNSSTPGGGPTPETPQWFELGFAAPVRATRLVITPRPGYGPRKGYIEVPGEGGAAARRLAELDMAADKAAKITFAPTTSARFRIVMTAAYDPRFADRPRNVQISELMLYDGDRALFTGAPSGDGIRDFEQKAYYRYPGQFTATEAWHLVDTAPKGPDGDVACRSRDVLDLSDRLQADGHLRWKAPAGRWRVLRFGYTLTGAHVSTCSDGAGGLAIDYLDRGAFETYWRDVMVPILADVKPFLGRSLRFLHTDSWELGPVNWTPAMPDAFARLHHYALIPYLPVLANYIVDSRETSTRVLNDFRRTVADLIAANKYVTFSEYAHAAGLGIHPESGGPHAAPIDALMNLGISDIPMGEFWARAKTHRVQDHQRYFVKQTSSAAHVYGRRLSLAEAYTTIGPQWERDPRMLKPCFDRAACEGHNLTMWHTFDCSPPEMGVPGQNYFAGTHLNPQVTWWPQAHAYVGYMNRCHFLLQQGLPVSDVLHYYGENIPSFVRLKRDDPARALPGYDYDVIDTKALLERVRVYANGRLVLPDGTSYRVLSIAPYDVISLPTLQCIASLVEQGATLVGRKPERPYSLSGGADADARFAQLATRLWGPPAVDGDGDGAAQAQPHRCGKGAVWTARPSRDVLQAMSVGPDFTWIGGDEQTLIDYIHRATDEDDIYFVANRLDRPERVELSFRVSGRQPELWDPVTAARCDARAFRQAGGRTILPLAMEAEASMFVVFRKPIAPDARGAGERNSPVHETVATLEGPWTVHFDPAWGGPASVAFDELVDWTRRPEDGIRHYSGKAAYERSFDWDPSLTSKSRVALDLGELKNLAIVRLNDVELGVVWSAPFRVDITDALRPGANSLRIEVVNLWPNRLIGDAALPEAQRRTHTNIRKFKKDSPLLPSGLLGPVRLLRAAE